MTRPSRNSALSAFRNSSAAASESQPISALLDAGSSAFCILDDAARSAESYGRLTISAPSAAIGPLVRHLVRRSRNRSRQHVIAGLGRCGDSWRELALSLGVFDTVEPVRLAERIAQGATGRVVIVAERHRTGWGKLVGERLETLTANVDFGILLIILRPDENDEIAPATLRSGTENHRSMPPAEGDPYDTTLRLDEIGSTDSRRWWEAVVVQEELLANPVDKLETLDTWWENVRQQPVDEQLPTPQLSRAGRELLGYILRAQEPLTAQQAAGLVSSEALDELSQKGLLLDESPRIRPRDDLSAPNRPNRRKDRKLAACLAGEGDKSSADPWSLMRASELYAECRDATAAEQLAHRSLKGTSDRAARDDLWRRWLGALEDLRVPIASEGGGQPVEGQVAHLGRIIRSAELALELGDGTRADSLAREGMRIDGDHVAVLLLRGRASSCRGDLTTASLSLMRALELAGDEKEGAQAAAELAEVRYLAGDHGEAKRYASEATATGSEIATRLAARNVLGKLHLAAGRWLEAEQHFAADAYEAAKYGESEPELRAQLNRGIAILSLGRREQARTMFEQVLTAGQQRGALRAVAYALANLATIAIVDFAFQEALELSERAIETRRQLGDRLGLVRPITNLAELRLRLGLVDEAEQALRFGLQACGDSLPASRFAYFALVAARIHFERANTADATRELSVARSGAACSGDGGLLGECERLAVRIALEDGDLGRADAAFAAAEQHTPQADQHPELAVLSAMLQLATGNCFIEQSRRAVRLTQKADDPEYLREAYLLAYYAARNDQDNATAQRHLATAIAQRNRMLNALPEALRSRFLARRELASLAELEAGTAIDATVEPDRCPAIGPQRSSSTTPRRRRVLVGEAPTMRALRKAIRRVGATNTNVLVAGETGTGKELVAEAIHRASRRRQGPLVKVNCAALVETLLLSELFGHEKGAFTGAASRRQGRFEVADGGTLFLDEIGDISPRTQVALLRVLQDGCFERVGGGNTLRTDVRIVCATHRDLRAMVERGEFREDLFYRLCGVVIDVPPLRDRLGDLPALAEVLLRDIEASAGLPERRLSDDALQGLARHDWPGNVRELENALRVTALFADSAVLQLADFVNNCEGLRKLATPDSKNGPAGLAAHHGNATLPTTSGTKLSSSSPCAYTDSSSELRTTDSSAHNSSDLVYSEVRSGLSLADMKRKLERECIARALVDSGGNITRAAALLGMKRPRLSQLVKQYQLSTVLEESKS